MIDLEVISPWAWSRKNRNKVKPELPVHNLDIEMVESTTNDENSAAHTPSESGSTTSIIKASPEAAEDQTNNAPKRPRRFLRWVPFFSDPEDVEDDRFVNKSFESIKSYHIGYPQWAAYQNSSSNFKIYKRFGTLRNRLLLHLQQEIAQLEEELNRLDDQDHKSNNLKTRSLVIDKEDADSERMRLIDQIENKLKRYDDLLERERRLELMEKPSPRDYRSLVNYIYNNKPVVQQEAQFLDHRDDFVLLAGPVESPLETMLDYLICRIPIRRIRRQFSSEAQVHKVNDEYTILTSPRKLFIIARGVASLLAILLISVPLFVLATEAFCEKTKLIVLLISLLAFPIAIQVAARPKNLELFVSTATYCAVLSTVLATSNTFDLSDLSSQLALSLSLRLGNSTAPT